MLLLAEVAVLNILEGNQEAARACYDESRMALDSLESVNVDGLAALNNLGVAAAQLEPPQVALEYFCECLVGASRMGDVFAVSLASARAGDMLSRLGRHEAARSYLAKGLMLAAEKQVMPALLEILAIIAQPTCHFLNDDEREAVLAAVLAHRAVAPQAVLTAGIAPSQVDVSPGASAEKYGVSRSGSLDDAVNCCRLRLQV